MPYGVDETKIEQVKAWVSFDDGATWKKRPVRATKDGYELTTPRGGGRHASLKVEVTDDAGNTVKQEVIRAYAL